MKSCASPTAFDKLVDFWTGELADGEAARLEEHLFRCDECAASCDRLAKLVGALREFIPPVISHAYRDRLLAKGARIRATPVEPGVDARARFSLDVDFLVHVLRADLSRAERVDVEVVMEEGSRALVFEAVPFDVSSGEVLVCCQRHFQHMTPTDPTFRLLVVEAGKRRCVGDYLVHHEWA